MISYYCNVLAERILPSPSHLSGAFLRSFRLRGYGHAPSTHTKNPSEICDLSVNIYHGTGS